MGAGEVHKSGEQFWLLPSEGEIRRDRVAEVAVATRTTRVQDFAIPAALVESVRVGVGVSVPAGRRGTLVDGICIGVSEREWDHTRKPISAVTQPEPMLNAETVALGRWISDYYACPPGKTFQAMIPIAVRRPRWRRVRYLRLTGKSPDGELSARQRALLEVLSNGERVRSTALGAAKAGAATLNSLLSSGVIEALEKREPAAPRERAAPAAGVTAIADEDSYELTAGQRSALRAIALGADAPAFCVHVLFGVPGSGKTEVYVRAIRNVIATGRQAILLVPEIALATQIVSRLARRFQRVAILHSRLTPAVRARTLRSIAAGDVNVVIGTRTAVLAPCPWLGLIVVDEEQETSFKSQGAPYFHARDVAIKRGQIAGVPVVLGSATPSLETWHNAQFSPHYRLLPLPERVPGARLPRVRLITSEGREPGRMTGVLSPELLGELRETLAAGHQAVLLHNRRGYSINLRCARCGLLVSCERCGGRMVFHQAGAVMKCHRCATRLPAIERCRDDSCGGAIERAGFGIQRAEEELRRVLPAARIARFDRDTLRRRDELAEVLRQVEAHEVDVLLGTQIVAKGLDFPGVRLVGVIDADGALKLPDFRSGERAFQLVMQVIGRAGRREGESRAVVQVEDPRAPAIGYAVRLDYRGFAETELAARHHFFYPPFSRLVRIVFEDSRPNRARDAATALAQGLSGVAGRMHAAIHVDAARRCALARVRERLRYHVLVRMPREMSASALLREARSAGVLTRHVERLRIDVDPVDLL